MSVELETSVPKNVRFANNNLVKPKNSDEDWTLEITPRRGLLQVPLHEIWQYRDLLVMFVKRDIVTVYKQTILGPLWFVIQPIMTMLVFVLVFGNIANISTDGIPQPLFYLAGIIMWNYFAETFTRTSTTFRTNAPIFGKVYFPRVIVPLALVISGMFKFLIQLILFLGVFAYYFITTDLLHPNLWLLVTPVMILMMAGIGLGFGLIFSSLTNKYRDLMFVLQFGVQLLMYATPIIYPMSLLSDRIRAVIWWNPMSHILEVFKFAFLGEGQISLLGLSYAVVFTITCLIAGIIIFNRTEQSFMDTV